MSDEQPAPLMPELLSAREREVLGLVAHGLPPAEICEQLGITSSTVRTHIEHARGKLGARTQAQAVAKAIATGQLEV